MLFSGLSLLTMFHGLVLGGGALIAVAAALFALQFMVPPGGAGAEPSTGRALSLLLTLSAALLWGAVIGGTYLIFPPYRVAPPEGVTELAAYPRYLLLANPGTAWLHAFAMETKEHVPWMAAMLATGVAWLGARDRNRLVTVGPVRSAATAALAIAFLLTAYSAVLGTFVNKVAPLQ